MVMVGVMAACGRVVMRTVIGRMGGHAVVHVITAFVIVCMRPVIVVGVRHLFGTMRLPLRIDKAPQ